MLQVLVCRIAPGKQQPLQPPNGHTSSVRKSGAQYRTSCQGHISSHKIGPSTVAARQRIRGSNPVHPLSTSSISLAARHLCYLFVRSPERDFNHVSAIQPCESDKSDGSTLPSIHALTAPDLHMALMLPMLYTIDKLWQAPHIYAARTTNLTTCKGSSTPNTRITGSRPLRWEIRGSKPRHARSRPVAAQLRTWTTPISERP
jgi:hypothetical protein